MKQKHQKNADNGQAAPLLPSSGQAALEGQRYRVRAFQFKVLLDVLNEAGQVKDTGQLNEVTILEAAFTPAMRQIIADCGLAGGLEPPS